MINVEVAPRASEGDIEQASLLLDVIALAMGVVVVVAGRDDDHFPFQPLGAVDGADGQAIASGCRLLRGLLFGHLFEIDQIIAQAAAFFGLLDKLAHILRFIHARL